MQPAGMQLPQVARVLPGPAGKLQELAAGGALQQATPEMLGLKSSISSGLSPSQASNQYDAAFLSSSWAAAKAHAAEDAGVAGPICSVKASKAMGVGKVQRMLLLMHSYNTATSGSAFSKVKDPSGTMGAALHSSALQQQPLLGPGCVLLLRNVSVLTPNPGSSYLAITADNIVKVWAPDQPGRSIRDTAHRPNLTQQQHLQQQQPHLTQQQQQQRGEGEGHIRRGPAGQVQRPGTAAPPPASGADSRCGDSFLPPPSPDIMSVLNQVQPGGAFSGAAAVGAKGGGPAATQHQAFSRGIHQAQQQQQQGRQPMPGSQAPGWPHSAGSSQQQQWRREQQVEFSPALSGAAGQHAATRQVPSAGPRNESMPPPPPRAPQGNTGHNTGQGTPAQQRQQQSQQGLGSSSFKVLSQVEVPLGAQVPRTPAAAAGGSGGGSISFGSEGTQRPVGRMGPPAGVVGVGSAPAHDADVEVDDNIVAAIFGSQVPKPVAPLQPPALQHPSQHLTRHPSQQQQQQRAWQPTQQQQQPVSTVSGAFRGAGLGHTTPAAGKQPPANTSVRSQQHTPALTPAGLSQRAAGTAGAAAGAGMLLGSARAPMHTPLAVSQQQQQQRAGGMPTGMAAGGPPPAGSVVRPGGFGTSLLGKRPMQVSLLDDLLTSDLDDL